MSVLKVLNVGKVSWLLDYNGLCIFFNIKLLDVCDDDKQLLYTKCSYIYPSGIQCTNPVPKYLDPLLCGGHCDNILPPESYIEKGEAAVKQEITLSSHSTNIVAENSYEMQACGRDEDEPRTSTAS